MKIAIHQKEKDFSPKWIDYCKKKNIGYKIVNCYTNDIIDDLEDCDALMWHFSQGSSRDILFAKQLMFSLETAGKIVFPDFYTAWHFDDKVGQKYLLESINAPMVSSYVFYGRQEALNWVEKTHFPKVFKLRGGAGSANVRIVENESDARKLISKAFGSGFSQYDKWGSLKERWYQYSNGKSELWNVIKGVLRFGRTTELARVAGRERGYIYFQEFIRGNEFDIRVVVIDGKAFAIKRMVREGDFRASGSGDMRYKKEHFSNETLKISFDLAQKLKSKSLAIDFVYKNSQPLIVEISYGFSRTDFSDFPGYWDDDLNWYSEPFNAQGWMVESVVKEIESRN